MSTIPSIKQILTQYLWGQETMPSSTELVDPKWIRPNNDFFEKEIDQYEYMTVGAGRYATVDMVPFFNKFFDSKLTNLPAGTYDFTSLVKVLYASVPESIKPTMDSKFDIYQYQMDIHSDDYPQRSYVHGSTKFSFNWKSMSFIVNSDGSKEIKNLQISAVNDDFNYESTTFLADITNDMTEELLDRSGLGRTVKLVFTGEAPVISSLTSAEFYAQKNSNENIRETYNERVKDNLGKGNVDFSQITMFKGVIEYILNSGITTPKDINGNDIYYVDINKSLDLKILNNILGDLVLVGNDSNNILEGQSGDNYIYGFSGADTLKGEFGDDYLFGGSGTDTLYGGHGNDYLYANSKDDSNDTGSNALYGGVGNDYLYGGSESDILVGNGGDDKIYGGAGDDILYAGDKENGLTARGGESDFLYGGKGNDILHYSKSFLFGGIGHLEGGEGFDTYKAGGTVIVNDSDGKGILYYDNKNLLGAEMRYQSDSLSPPPTLDFSKSGYDINDKTTGRLVEIARTDKYVRYIVTGDINFKYKDLTTEALDTRSKNDTDLGIKFYVTVYKDIPPPPPPFKPPHNPPTRSDPLTLDLNFDGKINTVELTQGVNFDLDGNKFAEKTSWISPQDGFVVLDLNKNNEIDNGRELFGTDTLLANGNKAIDGFQALAQYDENKDKIINEQDEVYSQLKIWKDLNQDGISQSNELFSLAELGIKSISVNNKNIDVTDENKVVHTNKATFEQEILVNGELIKKIGLAETLLFEVNTSNTVWQGEMSNETGIPLDILVLPDLPGYGSVASLHTVIANDTTGILKSLVSKFATTAADEQLALTHQILLYWTNNQNISDSATTYFQEGMSKQQFEILKVLLGKSTEWSGWPPHHSAARELEAFYQKVLKSAYSQLLSQTTKKDFIDLILFQEERIYETTIRLPVIDSNPYATIQQSSWDGKAPAPHPESIVLNAAWKHVDTIWHGDFNLAIERLTELFLQNNQLGKIEIEQFQLIVHGLDPNHDVLYKELFEQFSLKAQEITDENLRGLLLESIYVLDDNLSGTEQNDVMRSFGGNDNITALGGDDTVYGGIGNDTIYGGIGNDYLEGNQHDDRLYGDVGNDLLIGGSGNDYLDGGAGNDSYVFNLGDGQDTIQSYENNNLKIDQIIFNEGIQASSVSVKRDGNDLIIKYSEQDQITVRSYFDSTGEAAGRIDQIVFIDGTIWDVATIKAKVLAATTGNDILQGYNSADYLEGLAGNDTLYGYAGNDVLTGGSGNDYLDGGAGNDSYVFNLGDGQDTINSYEYNNLKIDRIIFNEGIEASSVSVKRDGNDLIIKYSEQDQITVLGYFDSNGEAAGRIDQIIFIDGTIWDVATIKAKVLAATTGNDILQGYNSADHLEGLAGNDTLYGYAGNDVLTGGSGNDYLDGGAGNDSYLFNLGDGQDTINSYENNNLKIDQIIFNEGIQASSVSVKRDGNDLIIKYSEQDQITVRGYFDSNGAAAGRIDQIIFIDGTIWDVATIKTKVLVATVGNDTLYGYAGNDVLTGGSGNDYLDGGAGNDSYVFNLGDGQDTIQSYEYNNLKIDRIIFNEGIQASSVSVKRDGNDLIIKYSEQDQITVRNYFDSTGEAAGRIDQIIFIDGTIWDVATIKAKVLAATTGNDILQGYNSADYLEGLAGNDTLYGYAGNDVLTGGSGNDYLDGGAGNDSYLFNLGDGQDTIQSYENNNLKIDRIIFNEGIQASSVSVKRDGNDLIIKYSEQDQITVRSYFDSNGAAAGRIDQIVFIDGTIWDVATIKAKVLAATTGNDILQGYNSADHLEGLAGNDTLYGYAGNDVLTGGQGNDYLDGGAGNDSYVFNLGDGQDTIQSYENNNLKIDRIIFNEGIQASSVSVKRDGNDLIIKYSEQDQITVLGYFDSNGEAAGRIDQIIFIDGTIWDVATIKAKVLAATTGNDILQGYNSADHLEGLAGNDTLYGYAGNDVLTGGSGNDYLDGGAGNDSYVFNLGDGQDTIQSYENNNLKIDQIIFNEGIQASSVSVKRDGNDLIIKYSEQDQITVRSYFDSTGEAAGRIDQIVFIDGTIWDVATIKAKVLAATTGNDILQGYNSADYLEGLAGNDTLYGYAGNDVLTGGSGNDYLDGGAGNDSYVFNLGDGQDTINSYEYNNLKIDRIIFNEGIEASSVSVKRDDNDLIIKYSEQDQVIVRDHFNNDFESGGRIDQIIFIDGTIWDVATIKEKVLAATTGNDILYGDSSIDHLEGLAGNDTLYGYAGNDVLTGGSGNDYLDGGAGNDSYVFNLGDGQDTINSYEYNNLKIDRIIFSEGIQASSVSVKRDGNDLIIKYSEQDQITVRNYFDSTGEAAGRIDQIVFIDGTIWDVATIKAKVLAATTGNDILQGYNSADYLEGLAGNDTLYGYAGNDVLTGGSGNDYLDGGFGNDSYIFGLNFDHDIIYNYDYEQNRQDIISFIDGLTQKDFEFHRNDNDLIIQTIDIKNSITVRNYFEKEALGSYRIDKIKFSDNTILDINDIKKLTLLGTEGADTLRAFKDGATLFGKGGDDTIYGNTGSDSLYGGIGKDILYGEENNDDLDGGDDGDLLYGGNGNDYLKGGAGNDELYGGDGSDTYVFDRGFGKDIIIDTNSIDNLNKVLLNNIYADEVVFIRSGFDLKDLILQIKGSSDSLTIRSFFTNDPYSYSKGENYYESIEVVDNSFDFKYIVEEVKKGSDYNDSIYIRDEYGYYINSADGNDVVNVVNGNYTIDSGSGDDNVYVNNVVNSSIYGGNGNDYININGGLNNVAYGGDGDDLLKGNGNGVVLSGGYGYDTYVTSGGNIIDLDYAGKIIVDANQMYFKWSQSESGITKWLVSQPDENAANLTSYTEYSSNSSLSQYQYTKFSNRLADIEYDAIKGEISLLKDNNIYFKIQNIFGMDEIDKIKNNMDIFISGTVSYRAVTAFHYKEFIETKLSFSDFMEQGKVVSKYDQTGNKIYGLTQLGKDTIYANGGDDYIYTGLGESLAYGEDGDDYIIATDINALDEVYGGIGNDTIYNYDINNLNLTNNSNFYQRDRLYGGDGNDIINVRYQNAQVYGEDGNDSLTGSGELYGGDGNDTLKAGDGGAYLDGGAGTDHLVGGLGDDTFIVDEQDTYEENDPNGGYDTIHISQNIDLSLGYLEAVTLLGNQNLSIYGNTSDNKLIGNAGNNYIDGRAGSDYMQGGLGNDYYVVDTTETIETDDNGNTYIIDGDQVVEDVDGGIDTLERWEDARFIGQDENGNPVLTDSYKILENNIENLILKGNAKTGFGNDLDNIIVGNEQDNYIDGLAGNDTYIFVKGGGTDIYSFADSIDALNILKIQGYSANDVSAQKYGDSVYISFKGTNDHIWLSNYYAVDTEDTTYKMDQIIFDSGDIWGTNDIDALVNRALTNHAPTVNAAIPLITSNQETEFSYKFANNIIVDQDSWDSLSYKITLTTKDSSGQYQAIPSWLNFDAATQTLSGKPPTNVTGNLSFFYWGTDMYGYGTATSFNLKVSLPNQAPTLLNAIADQSVTDAKAFSYTIPTTTFKDPDGDTLMYSATLEDGSPLPSWLSFNPTTRVLSGTSPDNTLPLNIKITVKDIANQSVSDVFKLTFMVQNQTINGTSNADTLYGASGNDTITGQAGNDILYGQSGNDTLNGGAGNDTMYGGKGDDIYIIDSATDIVSESLNEGTDTVQSSITYTLANNVENLTLTGTTAINGTGNILNNTITGNSAINTLTGGAGDDYLDGGVGADKLLGGLGNDTYVVDNISDVITENVNEGTDTIRSSVSLTLSNNVENLILTGTTAINGTGNTLNNVLTGNSAINTLTAGAGDDYLDGGVGADKLLGGIGNDTYVIDNSGDTVTENASEGIDTVLSSITYTLGSNLENLTLTGSTAINATGNTLNNTLSGNSGVNALNGGAGNDILDGQGGNDQLTGGTGADTALYQLLVQSDALGGNGTDAWSDFTMGNTTSNTNADKIDIGDLLIGYSGTYNFTSLEPFIKMVVSGSNTQLYIDRDGVGTTYSSSLLLTLNNTNANLNDVINNQQIII